MEKSTGALDWGRQPGREVARGWGPVHRIHGYRFSSPTSGLSHEDKLLLPWYREYSFHMMASSLHL